MKASSTLIVCALVAGAAMSCASKTADETGGLEAGASKACERLTPCDSDVTGEWRVDHVCFFTQPIGKYFFDNCPEGRVEAVSDSARGDFTFDKNGNYTEYLEYAGRVLLTIPVSCLASGKTCSVFEDDETTCETVKGECRCTLPIDTGSGGSGARGKYVRTGTTLDLEGDTAVNYCAKGDILKIETRVGMPEMDSNSTTNMQVVLKRR